MVIHSSSLTFSRVGFNRSEVGKNESAQKENENNELSLSKVSYARKFNKALTPLYSPDEIKQRLDDADLNLTLASPEHSYKPTDARTLIALNAYSKAINQPLQDQRAELIAGIDTYA